MTSVLFQILIIIARPINDVWGQRITFLIEASVSMYLYALLAISNLMGENTFREEIGWLLVLLIGTIVAINNTFFFYKCIHRAIIYIKPRVKNVLYK